MKMIKKLILLLLIMSTIITVFSCGNSNTPDKTDADDLTAGNPQEKTTASIEDIYPYPKHDFDGAAIKILARRDGYAGQDFEDIYVDEINGEVLNDAVRERTSAVEEKYNVKIAISYDKDPVGLTQKNVQADDDVYQIIQEKLIYLQQTLATQNYICDFNKIDGITLEAPWYNQNIIKDLSINKKVTALGGDMTISDKSGVNAAMFNKKMAADYKMENMYKIVREGKWTLEKMHELMTLTCKDLDGDGKMNLSDDQWGMIAEQLAAWAFWTGSGVRLAELDSNGIPYITAGTPKFLSVLDKILDIMYDKECMYVGGEVEDWISAFGSGRCFLQPNVISTICLMRGLESDFGIIPIPKLNEEQTDYMASISPWVSRFIAVPVTCRNTGTIGAVIDAMARESTNTVMPAYYDNLLNNKIARDDESIEMLKITFGSVVYDIGAVYNWGGLWLMHQGFINSKSRDYVSFYEKNASAIQAALDITIEEMF